MYHQEMVILPNKSNISKVYSISDEDFKKLIKSNKTFSDCLRQLNLSISGSASRSIIKRRIKELNINTDHFDRYVNNNKIKRKKKIISDEDLFKINSFSCTSVIKNRILKYDLMEYKCAICGNEGTWNNRDLTLQLDHINGNRFDNRLENLRFLCPNCHAQTETYGSKNMKYEKRKHIKYEDRKETAICQSCGKVFVKKDKRQKFCNQECSHMHQRRIEHPSKEQLLSDIEELNNNMCAIGRKYGVSDNTIRKWIKKLI